MTIKDTRKQLQFDTDKYLISNKFYSFLISQTNKISNYPKCRNFVRLELNKALKGEVEKVSSFTKNKIDFEL